jgi:hypothetical protein
VGRASSSNAGGSSSRIPRATAHRAAARSSEPVAGAATAARAPDTRGKRVVTVRGYQDQLPVQFHVHASPRLPIISDEWSYVLRNRSRWLKTAQQDELRTRAVAALGAIGVSVAQLEQFRGGGHVEVELHHWNEADADQSAVFEAAAQMPWEYLIGSATRLLGRFRSLWVTRVFRSRRAATTRSSRRKKLLFIESGPGRLSTEYSFDSERARINAATSSRGAATAWRRSGPIDCLQTEKRHNLEDKIRRSTANVLHVTGIDTHQVTRFIDDFYEDLAKGDDAARNALAACQNATGDIEDGMILRDVGLSEWPARYDTLAEILVPDGHHPELITLNLYYSAARTARALLQRGARAAIGFLDEVDDELAEYFFQVFYREWVTHPEAGLPGAFERSWRSLRPLSDKLHGTGIVLWTSTSQLQKPAHRLKAEKAIAVIRPPVNVRERAAARQRLSRMAVRDVLLIELEPHGEVNYSLLHNERPLLAKLTINKLVPEVLENLEVVVELNVGAQTFQFRCTELEMNEPQRALTDRVVIPLTAELPRSLRERVQTTVYVKVTWEGRTAFEETHRVTLIPVDEWHDDTASNPWLPSFVIPRDPAVVEIVKTARRYLVALRDDPTAGFDGYQAYDKQAEDPWARIDAQVQALWTALVNDYRLQYVNPPPSYSKQGQRLRTPSEVIGSNSGTCVDLALLLASCLEYIDVYPVIVLLTGHAFVGYWRSEEFHEEFVGVKSVPRPVPSVGSQVATMSSVPAVDPYGWRLGPMQYREVTAYARADKLRFLEATGLTSGSSFAEALEEGEENMRTRDEFDSLLDVQVARRSSPPVTPIPILQSQTASQG